MTDTISARDIEVAYALMLGRRPESPSVVADHIKNSTSLADLRAKFLRSIEFRERMRLDLGIATPVTKPLDWPRMHIDVDVSPNELAAMFRHIEENWALLGDKEPYWSVLISDKYKSESIGDNIKEFYASGSEAVSFFKNAVDRAGLDYGNLRRCFELGCGVGRLSVWFAQMFDELIAADISPSHLKHAREAIQRVGLNNVDLRVLNTIQKFDELPEFDCFVSIIVLQHNPPPVSAHLLATILRKLKPGGIAYFQIPTYYRAAVFSVDKYLTQASSNGQMEMHALPQAKVWQIAEQAGCSVADVREDGWVGNPSFISNSILLQKRT
jgi:SAM-dependent methyltransferase